MVTERRVQILQVIPAKDRDHPVYPVKWPIRAHVRGDDGEYSVGWNDGSWRCSCEANSSFRRRCSHIRAVALVVVPTH
jgi:hypothetical protein